jgi:hypothetical protein
MPPSVVLHLGCGGWGREPRAGPDLEDAATSEGAQARDRTSDMTGPRRPAGSSHSLGLPLPAASTRRKGYPNQLALSGFKAVIAPDEDMHTAPVALPGTLRPSPVSAVTVAAILSADGLLEPPFT